MISLKKTCLSLVILSMVIFHAYAEDVHKFGNNSIMEIKSKNIYPEGIAWSEKKQKLFISSVTEGVVRSMNKHGDLKVFIKDDSIITSVGLLVDDSRNNLWLASSDTGGGYKSSPDTLNKRAGVGKYDLSTGTRIAYYDLGKLSPGNHMANDMTIDSAGNVYITDSFSPTLWRVTFDGKASIYLQDSRFYVGEGYNLNGIVSLKDGTILLGNSLSGKIYKLSGKEHKKVTEVKLDESLKTLDGFSLSPTGSLFVVVNNGKRKGHGEVVQLASNDNWASAKIVTREETIDSMPTTAANISGDIWVLNAQLDKLLSSPKNPPSIDSYIVQKIKPGKINIKRSSVGS